MIRNYIALLFIVLGISTSIAQELPDKSTKPPADPAPEIEIGEYQSFTLSNGLKVFVVENHKIPRVAYSLVFDRDPVIEGKHAGYVGISGELIGTATTTRTKAELDEEIDFLGASLSAGASSVYAASLKKHNEKLLELMSDIILNSVFKEEELEKIKKKNISGLKAARNDPSSLSNTLTNVLIYGENHPFGEMETEESIQSVNLEMCRRFYETYYRPNIGYLAVIGDITVDEAKENLEKYLGDWEAAEVPEFTYNDPQAPEARQVVIFNRPEAVQSVIKIAYPVELEPGSEDAIAARVMNTVLGGGTYRLFDNLRETHGWTYGAYSSLSSSDVTGSFKAYADVANNVTDSAVHEILYEMEKLASEPVPADELQRVKNNLSGNFALSLEKPETVASFAINTARYNLPDDYYATYLQRLEAISVNDVLQQAQKYIKPAQSYVFIVGKADEIEENLRRFSPANTILYINENGEFYTPLGERKEAPEGLKASDVLKGYIQAVGGEKAISKLKDVSINYNVNVKGTELQLRRFYDLKGDQFSEVIMAGGSPIEKRVIVKDKGWKIGMNGAQAMPEDEVQKAILQSLLFPELEYLDKADSLKLDGIENVNGKESYVVEIYMPGENQFTAYYSVGDQLKASSKMIDQGIVQQTYYEDYEQVNGIRFPKTITQNAGGQVIDIVSADIQINKGIDPKTFEVKEK